MRGEEAKRWIARKDGQDHGPFSRDELVDLVKKGELLGEHVIVDARTKDARTVGEWPLLERAIEERKRALVEEARLAEEAARERRARRKHLGAVGIYALVTLVALGALAARLHAAGPTVDGVVAGLVGLYVLVCGAIVAYVERDGSQASEAAFHAETSDTAMGLGALLALLSAAPLAVLAPYAAIDPTVFGEELGHARLAREIAEHGLSRGWIEAPLAGFPFGVHEPGAVALLVRALMSVGLGPIGATHLLGALGAWLTPLAAYVAGLRAHLRPPHALAGALAVGWIASNTPAAGGFEAFFAGGLLPSALAVPLCALAMGEIARAETRWVAPMLCTAAVLIDPSLAFATLLVAGVASAAAGSSVRVLEVLRSTLAAGAIAAALYGHGLANVAVPFGLPAELAWRHVGFPAARLRAWLLEGGLLDHDRTPLLTYLAGASLLALALQARRPAARAALAACVTAIAWPVLAHAIFGESTAPLATAAIQLLQPVHALALAPLALAAAIAIALEESAPRLEQVIDLHAPELDRAVTVLAFVIVGGALTVVVPERIAFAATTRDAVASARELPCGPLTPEGYDHAVVSEWLAGLEGGRVILDDASLVATECGERDALVLESAVPVASTEDVGAHVGILHLAFDRLALARAGSRERAEALGVAHALTGDEAAVPEGWEIRASTPGLRLISRTSSTGLVGAGCVTERWRGKDDALRAHLEQTLRADEGADALLSPTRLVAIVEEAGPLATEAVAIEAVPAEGCDPSRVSITTAPRETGAIDVDVSTAAPVDLVFRTAAFPSWGVIVDGAESHDLQQVAPGFLSVRVGAGRHRVVARANGLPWRWPGLALAVIVALLAAFARREWLERKSVPLVERRDPWARRKR
ncbi:MAG: hypothetical protein U0353_10100 [Sandaracinus sp.]